MKKHGQRRRWKYICDRRNLTFVSETSVQNIQIKFKYPAIFSENSPPAPHAAHAAPVALSALFLQLFIELRQESWKVVEGGSGGGAIPGGQTRLI
jgi:hypothetical protein